MATTDANGFITIENSDLFNISHANGNAAAASAVATRVTTAEGAISDIQTALGTKVNSSTYTSGMATKVDKVDGKGLSTEDYTTAEKNKLAGIADGANNYSLPTASTNTLGGVKVGDGLAINDGVLSAGVYALPTASASTKGGIKVGNGLDISSELLSLKYGLFSSPVSSVTKNGSTTVSPSSYHISGAARFLGEGSSESPAIVTATIKFIYEDMTEIAANSYFCFYLNGFTLLQDVAGAVYSEYPYPGKVCGALSSQVNPFNNYVTVSVFDTVERNLCFSFTSFAILT